MLGLGSDSAESGDTLKLWHYEGADSAMAKAWDEAIKVFEEETGAKVEFEQKAFEQIQQDREPGARLGRGPRPHGVQQGQRHRRLPREHGPDHRHLRRGRRVRLGRQARPLAPDDREVLRRRRHGRRHLVRRPELRRVRRRVLQQGRLRRRRARDPDHLRRVHRRARRLRRAGHHAAGRGRRRVPARPALVPARAAQGRPPVRQRLPALREPRRLAGS